MGVGIDYGLGLILVQNFRNQMFAPGQQLLMDFKAIPLRLTVKTVELVDLSSMKPGSGQQQQSNPTARGILTPELSLIHI